MVKTIIPRYWIKHAKNTNLDIRYKINSNYSKVLNNLFCAFFPGWYDEQFISVKTFLYKMSRFALFDNSTIV